MRQKLKKRKSCFKVKHSMRSSLTSLHLSLLSLNCSVISKNTRFIMVARALNLPYPGGVSIENLAASGDRDAIPLPRPMIHDPGLDFSFAGLKTAVVYHLRRLGREPDDRERSDIAASFQEAVASIRLRSATPSGCARTWSTAS